MAMVYINQFLLSLEYQVWNKLFEFYRLNELSTVIIKTHNSFNFHHGESYDCKMPSVFMILHLAWKFEYILSVSSRQCCRPTEYEKLFICFIGGCCFDTILLDQPFMHLSDKRTASEISKARRGNLVRWYSTFWSAALVMPSPRISPEAPIDFR
jgi:hypothetical protein